MATNADQVGCRSSFNRFEKVLKQAMAIALYDETVNSAERTQTEEKTKAEDEWSAEHILQLNNKWALQKRKLRVVYIKMRPIDLGLPPELEYRVLQSMERMGRRENFTPCPAESEKHAKRSSPSAGTRVDYTRSKANRSHVNSTGGGFFGLHWAVEVGPWTIELAKDPFNPDMVAMKSTHARELDESWEKEEDRFKVGLTQASDEDLEMPGNIFNQRMQPYNVFRSNCQHSAAKFAMMICRDHVCAFDEIFHCERRSTSFLDMTKLLCLLKSLEGWADTGSEFLCRLMPVVVRTIAWKSIDGKDGNRAYSMELLLQDKRTKKALTYYSKFESALFANVGQIRSKPRTTDDYVAHVSQNMRLKSFESLADITSPFIARNKF